MFSFPLTFSYMLTNDRYPVSQQANSIELSLVSYNYKLAFKSLSHTWVWEIAHKYQTCCCFCSVLAILRVNTVVSNVSLNRKLLFFERGSLSFNVCHVQLMLEVPHYFYICCFKCLSSTNSQISIEVMVFCL